MRGLRRILQRGASFLKPTLMPLSVTNRTLMASNLNSARPRPKRRKFVDPVVVEKIKSTKKIAEIYENMKIKELAAAVSRPIEEIEDMLEDFKISWSTDSDVLDMETVTKVASAYGYKPKLVARPKPKLEDDPSLDAYPQPPPPENELKRRAPVITIMGHVDHGKTTLLDQLRHSRIVESEYGGITQHIGAFTLKEKDCELTFLDTPGHAAFAKMRERGAHSTDIVILVVAADDGVNEQTIQSLRYARDAGVPIVVAINKIDKANANPLRAKESLAAQGVLVESLGGDVLCADISALQGTNINELKDAVLLQAEDMNLRSTWKGLVEGVVIESQQSPGIGKVCTMIVQRGTLKKGAALVAGTSWAKVRLMKDEFSRNVTEAGPSTPVIVAGWRGSLPTPGDKVLEVENEQRAQQVVDYRKSKQIARKVEKDWEVISQEREKEREIYLARRQKLLDAGLREGSTLRLIAHKEKQYQKEEESQQPLLKIMLHSDVDGTLEAILNVLETYNSTKVDLELVKFDVGLPNESDIELAKDLGVVMYCFNLDVPTSLKRKAENAEVELLPFRVIYRLVEDLKKRLSDYLPEEIEYEQAAEGHVIKVFSVTVDRKKQSVGGVLVDWGAVEKTHVCRVLRGSETVYEGPIKSLKITTQAVKSAGTNEEVGIALPDEDFVFKEDDVIETYTEKRVKKKIDWNPPGF